MACTNKVKADLGENIACQHVPDNRELSAVNHERVRHPARNGFISSGPKLVPHTLLDPMLLYTYATREAERGDL